MTHNTATPSASRLLRAASWLWLFSIALAFSPPLQAAAPARTLADIRSSGEVVIAVFSDRAPFDYVDHDGSWQGFNILYGNRIASDLGVRPRYVPVDPATRIEFLASAKADIVLADFSITPERSGQVDFALPYMKASIGVVSPADQVCRSVEELYGQALIVTKGSITEQYFHTHHPQIRLLKYAHTADTYQALLDGRAAALAADNTEVLAWARGHPGFTVGIQSLGDTDLIAAAVQKGNRELLAWLNDHIRRLGEERFFHRIFEQSLAPFYGADVEADAIVIEGGVY